MDSTTRITRECSINELNPALRDAMRAHIVQYQLGPIEDDILMCCETTSIRQKTGLFGGTEDSISAVFVTPKWLVWADSVKRNAATIGAGQLKQISIRDYKTTAMYAVIPDMGINVTGRFTDVNKTGAVFIGLGLQADGQKFQQILEDAIKKASNNH